MKAEQGNIALPIFGVIIVIVLAYFIFRPDANTVTTTAQPPSPTAQTERDVQPEDRTEIRMPGGQQRHIPADAGRMR